ncbi:MAG: 4-(cytidine 5'-diphospho)-2-C-methyl-D-erythritol kinase [Armatimonadota bacterium]|nr:4-(cytidine 5'-diphospho)-2-C-methyl-D-erythritol kinase [Armatimonadota bacterium]MDR5675270.1 4-(cytidine 5'-diphospho)-2-C-methyl-D-erythritol kinase [Armatimonadota bacterium]MDR5688744.1 4-(cytidine 5'-diphospho)-2-C-methyl-D-erythritol kinase [Armatimonadota bacterium]MDR7389893.1 4-(cytidine 5'-diphospho)-2-C-methyl-D-erythritol kinase [Armatimonadota bacterium]MDR7392647.1 4-(cytidine 5'-diphospho)-2-C-methyl-D-erythritol kinase [Armatimonadota bacterium]
MKELRLNAYGKVNLSLDVLARRPDGYHEVETVLHTVELHDTVVLRDSEGGIRVVCDHRRVPTDEQNLVFRTAQLLREVAGTDRGVEIEVRKRIPPASGLGGGSSDAAVTLLGLAQMWKLRLDHAQLLELAAQVGSDVPFFLVGGAALATGRGERLRYLPTLPATWVVLACPDAEVSTAWAYANLDLARVPRRPNTQRLVEALRAEDVAAVARELCNVFEPLVSERYPQVQELKRRLLEAGALGASMTGTGPAVFGLFPGEAEARRAWEALRASADAEVVLTRTFAELER